MFVTAGGRTFEIRGILYGTGPAWKLVLESGEPMTNEKFSALPSATQKLLVEAVKHHIGEMNAGSSPPPAA